MQSSNPAFRNLGQVVDAQRQAAPSADYLQQMYNQPSYTQAPPVTGQRYMTLDDVVTKTVAVLGVGIAAAVATIVTESYNLMIPAFIVGLVLSLVVIFKQSTNPALILAYAAAQGVALGAITGLFESFGDEFKGIGLQALVGTFGVFAGMLVVYKTGAIRVTPKFTRMIVGAMIGIVVLLLFNLVASWLDINTGIRDGGPIAIVISVVIIAVAALSFLLDFDAIDKATKAGVPPKMAWYFAFSLMVTMVWLYLEILRLLGYLRSE